MAENDIVYGDQLSFLNDLRHKMNLSAEEESKLIKSLKFAHFKKGESVDGQNELLKNMIFLIRGSARTYYIERGREHNFAFTFASHFLIRPETIIRSGHHHIIIKFMEPPDVCYVRCPTSIFSTKAARVRCLNTSASDCRAMPTFLRNRW